ncbi:MAG: RNA polymerase-binding protein DksA [Nitrospirae bacterium]|nr:MAG: RNA polymerase-binding protein DksA [Nitrospirota bacterium]
MAKTPSKKSAAKGAATKKSAGRKAARPPKGKDRWAEIRKQLEERRAQLLEEARRSLDDSLSNEKEVMAEIGDRATEEIDDTFQARLKGREAKLIAKIDETLARIARGEYGLCESCGEEIAYERLLARPVTTMCIDCKTAQERQERNYRQ